MLRRLLRASAVVVSLVLVLAAAAVYLFGFFPLRNPHPPAFRAHGTLAIEDALVYTSPDDPPLEHATVVVIDGKIAAVGAHIPVPPGAQLLACHGCAVTAGFWNAHIHFTQREWLNSEWKPAPVLNAQLADMLTSRGFTTVVDLGSDLRVTIPLRRRTESGELLGPRIYTAGSPQYPPNGIPYYLRDTLPKYLLRLLPQPATPREAATVERNNIWQGADLLKLFTGSIVELHEIRPMPVANARAAVEVAHAAGQLAFAHPSDLRGVKVAIDSQVDVLAHAPSAPEGVTPALLGSMVGRHMAMVPTLKMFATTVTTDPRFLEPIYAEVRSFHILGGDLFFGTDVGYMTDYSTEDEFAALERCGLDAKAILRMLTTAPATRFKVAGSTGRIAPGYDADLVVLAADPASSVRAFAQVLETVRAGRVIYRR